MSLERERENQTCSAVNWEAAIWRKALGNWGKPTIWATLLTNRNCAASSMDYNSSLCDEILLNNRVKSIQRPFPNYPSTSYQQKRILSVSAFMLMSMQYLALEPIRSGQFKKERKIEEDWIKILPPTTVRKTGNCHNFFENSPSVVWSVRFMNTRKTFLSSMQCEEEEIVLVTPRWQSFHISKGCQANTRCET